MGKGTNENRFHGGTISSEYERDREGDRMRHKRYKWKIFEKWKLQAQLEKLPLKVYAGVGAIECACKVTNGKGCNATSQNATVEQLCNFFKLKRKGKTHTTQKEAPPSVI